MINMNQEDFDKRVKYFHENMPKECPILYSMSIIGSKWKIPVMWYLMLNDGQHYNELKRSIGAITNTMLTKSLRELEKDGLLKRVSKGTVPPSVTYHLTDTGKNLIYTMGDLFEWGKNHMEMAKNKEV